MRIWISKNLPGLLLCLAIAIPSWAIGARFPVVGGPVIAIIIGMFLALILKNKTWIESGVKFTSKKILQWAVVLLGFGLNLRVVMETGVQSLPIILCTISTSLIVAFALHKALKIPGRISTLIGVGSSICGGSAVAATSTVIGADDEEVAQAISVIFLFNVIAALIFPALGSLLGIDAADGTAFGIFAGTAINDTSSVTAAASTWDSMWGLGTQTLDKAVTVKLTRTLAIIPITLVLAFIRTRQAKRPGSGEVSMRKIFPVFIVWFIAASAATTIATALGCPDSAFSIFKSLSKFFIIMAMAAVGLNTDLVKLIRNGGKPILLGLCCWVSIAAVSILMQFALDLM